MPTNEILNSHSVSTLKKEISKTNIKGYSKMKKAEIISLMMKPEHSKRFSHIKMKDKTVIKKEPKKETPKKEEKPKAKLGESGIGKKRKRENKPIKKKVIDVAMPKKEPKKEPKKIPKITITEEEKPKQKVYSKGGKFFKPKEVKSKLPPIPKSNIKIRLPKKEEPKKEEPKKKEPKKKKEKEKTLSQIPSNLKKLWKEFVNERVGSFLEKYQLEEYESLKNMEERFRDLEIKKKDKTLRAKEKFNIINDIGDIVEDIKENIEDEPRFDKVYKILTPRIYARVKADLKEKKKEESKN
jgi:hypothetical protein|tara:strand:- start:4435 stop:5325 length:891 start_codon:yes stop_codon:yes gene_type:complete